MFKKILVIILLIVIFFSVCFFVLKNDNEETTVKHLIGVSFYSVEQQWQINDIKKIQDYASTMDDVALITYSSNESIYKQIKDIDALMAYGIDLLIYSSKDSLVLKSKIEELDIPVISIDSFLDRKDFTTFIGPDYTEIGKKAIDIIDDYKIGMDYPRVLELKSFENFASSSIISNNVHDTIPEHIYIKSYFVPEENTTQWIYDNITILNFYNIIFCHNMEHLKILIDVAKEKGINIDEYKIFTVMNPNQSQDILDYDLPIDDYISYEINITASLDEAIRMLESADPSYNEIFQDIKLRRIE